MKIFISHPKLRSEGKFTSNEEKFIHVLEIDDEFEFYIKMVRRNAGLPEEGYDLEKPISIYNDQDELKNYKSKAFFYGITWLRKSLLNLPEHWEVTLRSIAVFNFAFAPDKSHIKPFELINKPGEISITIREPMPIYKIKQLLDNLNKDKSLDMLMDKLPHLPKIGISDFNNAAKLVSKMDRSRNIRPVDLAKEMNKDIFAINKQRNRYNKYLRKYVPKNYQEALNELRDDTHPEKPSIPQDK